MIFPSFVSKLDFSKKNENLDNELDFRKVEKVNKIVPTKSRNKLYRIDTIDSRHRIDTMLIIVRH